MITFIIQFCSALSLTKLSEIIVLGRLRLPKTIISEYRDTKNFYYKFLIVVYLITTTYAGTIFQIYEYFEFGRLPFGDAIPILNLPLDGKNTFDVTLERGNYYAKVYDRFRNELYTEIFILK